MQVCKTVPSFDKLLKGKQIISQEAWEILEWSLDRTFTLKSVDKSKVTLCIINFPLGVVSAFILSKHDVFCKYITKAHSTILIAQRNAYYLTNKALKKTLTKGPCYTIKQRDMYIMIKHHAYIQGANLEKCFGVQKTCFPSTSSQLVFTHSMHAGTAVPQGCKKNQKPVFPSKVSSISYCNDNLISSQRLSKRLVKQVTVLQNQILYLKLSTVKQMPTIQSSMNCPRRWMFGMLTMAVGWTTFIPFYTMAYMHT